MSKGPLVKLDKVVKTYQMGDVEVRALRGVSAAVSEGEFVSITGPSGSGKSTLMHIVGCLEQPTTGDIFIEGEEARSLSRNKLAALRNKKIGFVFQTFNLLPRATALKNVILPLVYAGIDASKRKSLAEESLAQVGLADRLEHRPSELSGGQRQRVAIARALVNQPKVILADEPTGNLDSKSGAEIMSLLEQLHNQGKTIILVTHETYVAEHAQRILGLLDGEIVSDKKVKRRKSATKKTMGEDH